MSMSRKIRFAGVLFGLLAVLTMATVAGAQSSNGRWPAQLPTRRARSSPTWTSKR